MDRAKEFIEEYKEFSKQEHVGRDELKSFCLHEIAFHLAIIADCLEDKKVRKDIDSDKGHGDAHKMQ